MPPSAVRRCTCCRSWLVTWLALIGARDRRRCPAVRRRHRRHRAAGVGHRQLAGRASRSTLPALQPLARPTVRLRRRRHRDRRLPAPEQPADRARRDPQPTSSAPSSPSRTASSTRTTASTPAASSGPCCRTSPPTPRSRAPRRSRCRSPRTSSSAGIERDFRYKAAADPLRDDAREQVHQGRDPRALPQHRLLRQQRLRRAGGGRDLLRQDRRPADVRRGGVPRRARALAVRLRPDRQPRAQPRPLRPGRSTCSSTPAR